MDINKSTNSLNKNRFVTIDKCNNCPFFNFDDSNYKERWGKNWCNQLDQELIGVDIPENCPLPVDNTPIQKQKLQHITDEDALYVAAMVGIGNNPTIRRTGISSNRDSIIITDGLKDRVLRVYFDGSNTRLTDRGFEIIHYCYDIYSYLRSIGYYW